MTPRNLALWMLAAVLLLWIAVVSWQTQRCHTEDAQFSILGWRCIIAKPSVILRRELERT